MLNDRRFQDLRRQLFVRTGIFRQSGASGAVMVSL
jgi:hypothetical protein